MCSLDMGSMNVGLDPMLAKRDRRILTEFALEIATPADAGGGSR